MSQARVEILLVEDNPCDAELTLNALDKHHLANRVHVVRDGAEALEYIFCTGDYASRNPEAQPLLILVDLKMPRLDGLEVVRRVKDDPHTHHIPVVVLTSSREERDIVESYNLGVNSYIVKPVDFEQFTEAVSHVGMYWVLLNEPPAG
jgi:two-component system response regulator